MTDYKAVLARYKEQILQAIDHLEYSFKKVQKLSPNPTKLSTEDLETWEAFVARFARVSDIFLAKYVRTYVLREDPAFRGSFRDFLDQGEKLSLLQKAEDWMNVRELRNSSAHEYSPERLTPLHEALRNEAPRLIQLRSVLKA